VPSRLDDQSLKNFDLPSSEGIITFGAPPRAQFIRGSRLSGKVNAEVRLGSAAALAAESIFAGGWEGGGGSSRCAGPVPLVGIGLLRIDLHCHLPHSP